MHFFIISKVNVTNETNTAEVTGLVPFTTYIFIVDSCNSVGCVSSSNPVSNNRSRIKTLPAHPDEFHSLILNSRTSYSVDVEWKAPDKPNGIIAYYILERIDYSPPLSMQIVDSNNNADDEMMGLNDEKVANTGLIVGFKPKMRRYRFEADKRSFTDYDDLDSCALYSYRMLVFNQVNKSTHANNNKYLSRVIILNESI